ncbi:RAB6-interacting golgin, partial [Toxorhynchites rutilus septentrionalis]|uniref:RAB6-interacting golgin n=1 Tax=Toxorhynchites rutilus septentrionalis TaxID=329112 RepID=UPI002479BB52
NLCESNIKKQQIFRVKMSKPFVGFSDDDIYKIKRQTNGKDSGKHISRPHQKPVRFGEKIAAPTMAQPKELVKPNVTDSSITTSCVDSSIYPNHPIQQAVAFKPLPLMMNAPEDESILILPTQLPVVTGATGNFRSIAEGATLTGIPASTPMDRNIPDTVTPFKGMSLKDFEQQRRLMQEQNKQKRAMLQKTIDQHAQKTAAEASKLQEIRTELAKLDTELASDVSILRKQIDAASLHFSNVEKNYLSIENLFLKAKVELHQAHERKEMLTEHLCTIISHNEERKAKRLSELMEKVGLSVNGDFDDTINTDVSSSQISSTVDTPKK